MTRTPANVADETPAERRFRHGIVGSGFVGAFGVGAGIILQDFPLMALAALLMMQTVALHWYFFGRR